MEKIVEGGESIAVGKERGYNKMFRAGVPPVAISHPVQRTRVR
jgi:hypothetical protein